MSIVLTLSLSLQEEARILFERSFHQFSRTKKKRFKKREFFVPDNFAEKKRFKKREFFMPHHLAHLFFGQKISNF